MQIGHDLLREYVLLVDPSREAPPSPQVHTALGNASVLGRPTRKKGYEE